MSSTANGAAKATVTLTLDGTNRSTTLPLLTGTIGPAVVGYPQALRRPRRLHLRPGLWRDGLLRKQDHLYRRRCRHAAVSRLSDRAAGGEVRLHRGLPTCCWTANCRTRRSSRRSARASPTTPWCMSSCGASSTASAAMRTRWRCSAAWSARWRPSTTTTSTSTTRRQREIASYRLIAKVPTIAAWAYKYSIGQPFMYPRNDLSYAENFLLHAQRGAGGAVRASTRSCRARWTAS